LLKSNNRINTKKEEQLPMFSKLIRTSELGAIPEIEPSSWHLRDRIKAWLKQYPWMIITVACIILWFLLILMTLIYFQHQSLASTQINNNKNATLILNELNDINNQLQPLSASSQHSRSFQAAFEGIQSDLESLQKQFTDFIQTTNLQHVSSQLTDMHHDVDQQLLDLKNEVAGSNGTKNYLDPHLLPFQVIAVDVITGQPYVSINFDQHIMPLMIGDTLVGWTLIDADYSTSHATFQNNQHQLIQIQIP